MGDKDQETADRLSAIPTDQHIEPEVIMMLEKKKEEVISGGEVQLRRIEDKYIRKQIQILMDALAEAVAHNVCKSNTCLIIECIERDHGKEAAEAVAATAGTTVSALKRQRDWMTLEQYNRVADATEDLYRTPMAMYRIGRRIHKLLLWGLADALVKAAGSLAGRPGVGFKSIKKGMRAFNNNKDAEDFDETATSIKMILQIHNDVDAIEDILSRFFVPAIICSVPEIWMMLAALFDELYLQFDPVEMLQHYERKSEKYGLELPIDNPYIDENGIFINCGERYGQRVKVRYDEKGIATITSLDAKSCDAGDPVFIEKDIVLGQDEENGNILYIIHKGQLTNMPYTLYAFKWQNPSWKQIGKIFWKNFQGFCLVLIRIIKSFSFKKLFGAFVSPRKIMLDEIERERQGILDEFSIFQQKIDQIQNDLAILKTRNAADRKAILLAWTKRYETIGGATPGHVDRVREVGLKLWDYIEPEVPPENKVARETMEDALELHDIGKATIPEHILKKEGEFTPAEAAIMKMHSYQSERIMLDLGYEDAVFGAYHHERVDGSGYIHGFKGDQLAFVARLPAIVDVFDALCTPREYKKAFPLEKAIEILHNDAKRNKFDAWLVEKFVKLIEKDKEFFMGLYGKFWET